MVIETSAVLLLALALLTVPLNWLAAFLVAASVHELSHCLALRLLGGHWEGISIGPFGAVLTVSRLSPGREALCALAGPLGGLCLLPLYRWFPRLALWAAVHSAFNLLPIRPLDGGRVVHGVLMLIFPESRADAIEKTIEIAICCLLLLLSVSANLGPMAVALTLLCILKALSRKIPCKLRLPGLK